MKTSITTQNDLTRREFLATSAAAGAGLLLGASAIEQTSSAASVDGTARKTRYAIVGVGGRSYMYRGAILKTYAQSSEMVGFCDNNLGRLKLAQRKARELAGVEVDCARAWPPRPGKAIARRTRTGIRKFSRRGNLMFHL